MNQFVILLLGLINLSFEVEYFGPQSVTQNVCSYDGGHLEVRLFDCGKPCPQDWTTLPSGSQQNGT